MAPFQKKIWISSSSSGKKLTSITEKLSVWTVNLTVAAAATATAVAARQVWVPEQ